MPVIIDSYSESNWSTDSSVYAGYIISYGQSFSVSTYNYTLTSAKFYLKKFGSPTGNITAEIFAHTGTYGSNGKPTGSALATSDAVSIAGLSTSSQLISFTFSGVNQITLSAGTKYVVVVTYNGGDSSNGLSVGGDNVTRSASGNASYSTDNTSWTAYAAIDVIFYVYGNIIYIDSFSDLQASANISDYKWVSKKLKTAQQSQAVRPHYECRIVDDSVEGNSITTPPSPQPLQGSACTGPDGFMYAVGLDMNNNVGIWKGAVSAVAGGPSTTLESDAHNRSTHNHYAISSSDWINGTFKLDVYFFGNWDNFYGGGFLTIIHYYSWDKGNTWHTDQVVNTTIIPYTQTTNLWISAGKPFQADNGNTLSTVFYIDLDGSYYDITYQQYLGTGGTYEQPVKWSKSFINSRDWNIHSFDVAYINGFWYIAFSGFHSILEPKNQNSSILNYNIYLTKITYFSNGWDSNGDPKSVWSPPVQIISALSTSTSNKNRFTMPSLLWDEKYLWIVFNSVVVDSITNEKGTTNINTVTNYYIAKSKDLQNFSYPIPAVFYDVAFSDTVFYSYIFQAGKYWIVGGGSFADFIVNNIVADISNDIINYETIDSQQNPSTISMNVGNANGKWRGASPTQNGYLAIDKNKKICLFQGYYNSDGVPEVAPKNTFYIDDIQQHVSVNRNDFSLLGRDFYKNLKVLKTKFAYNYTGIKKYIDLFDGTTLGNYNLISGEWEETNNTLHQSNGSMGDVLSIFSIYKQTKSNTTFSISATLMNPGSSAGSPIYIYFYYIDPSNYLRLYVDANGSGTTYAYKIQKCVSGTITDLSTGTFSVVGAGTNTYPFLFIRNSYFKYSIYVGTDANDGEGVDAYSTFNQLGSTVDFSLLFSSVGTVAFGGFNTGLVFKNFRYLEFDNSLNIAELLQTIGVKSGIFDYKFQTTFEDYFFNTSNYSGTFTSPNRVLTIGNNQTVFKNDLQIDNSDVEFEAKMNPTSGSQFYFDFIFRNTGYAGATENYFIRIYQDDSLDTTSITLYNTHSSSSYRMLASISNLHIDFKNYNKFRVIFFGSYIFLAINDIIVYGWFDNNITSTHTTGYIGFRTDTATRLQVKSVIGHDLYTQIDSFSINPEDDLENSMESLIATIRVYFFSDLMGRLKVLRLSSTDPSKYTYQDQITVQQVDNSDKEYVNQVTVIGTGVQATVRDTVSVNNNSIVREEVIVDYKITSYNDAVTRANLELTNFNKFNNQYNPKSVLNVGSEMYDVITVINTGNNTSNVNQNVRIYSQDVQVGGEKLSYWQSIQSGKL